MSWPRFAVRRPVTTVMIYLGVMLLGLIAWTRLPQELFPPITYPQLTVVTRYKDAGPEEIELLITKPIEEVTGTVPGLRRVSSISKEGLSLVIAEFNWDTNMDFAALGVREKIDLIKERLPRGSEDPVVIKYNPFDLPVLVLNLSGDVHPNELLKIARKQIKNELEKVEGVAAVNLSGGLEREILVEVDQGRLEAANLPISHVVDSISRANLNYPAGTIKEAFYEYLIRTMGEFSLVKEIPNVAVGVDEKKESPEKELRRQQRENSGEPLAREKGEAPRQRLILLKDVATVKDTFRDRESISRYQGKDNISLSIQKQAGANTLQLVSRVREAMQRIRMSLPPGVKLSVAYDQSIFIRNAIAGVRDAAFEGGVLAFLVLFLFLGNFWAALNVTFAIPISVLATVGPMYFSGITINVISMGGLALSIGMLADAGTVAVENIDLKRREGKPSKLAAVEGIEEIASALFGTINTTVVVFLPMVFVVGIAGQIFKQLTYTVIISHYSSLAVAMTLTPLFASMIRYEVGKSPIEGTVDSIRRLNTKVVTWFMRYRVLGISVVALLFVGSLLGLAGLDRETLPKVDQGQFILRANLPPGTRLEATDRVARRIEQVLRAIPEVRDVTVTIGSSKERSRAEELLETLGSNQAQLLVNLKPRYQGWGRPPTAGFRVRKTSAVIQELKDTLSREPLEGARMEYLLQESVFKSSFLGGAPVVVEVKGPDLGRLEKLASEVGKELESIPGLYGIQSSLVPPSPEVKVHILKDRAATYHLSVNDIALTAHTALGGFVASKFKEQGEGTDIRVRLAKRDRSDFSRVRRLLIHSPLDTEVPLSEVAYLSVGKGPTEIRRLDQQRSIVLSAQLYGRPLNETLEEVSARFDRMKVASGYTVALTGESRRMKESFQSLAFALTLSVLLVYMVMASEFESLWQPFLIMGTIPMGIIGVFAALWLTHTPVSIMSILGVIVLGGLVVDDGIVLVDYINLLRRRAVPLEEAVVLASERRLRPIIMTSATTVLGLLPLALGFGEGVELQGPMAIAVMGGMTVCTFMTLIFLPTIYVVGAGFFEKLPWASRFAVAEPAVELAGAAGGAGLGIPAAPFLEPALPPPVIPPAAVRPEPPPPQAPPEVPEIPEGFGGEEAVPDRPDAPMLFPGNAVELPEPPAPSETAPPAALGEPGAVRGEPEAVRGEPVEPRTETPPENPPQPVPAGPPENPPEPSPLLNPRQEKLLRHLKKHGRISRKEYAKLAGASVPTAARDLKELVDRGLIKGIGPLAKGRYYVPAS